MNVYPFIAAEKTSRRAVTRACRLLGVSRSAFYQHARGAISTRQRADEVLTAKIAAVHADSNGTYGSPRIQAELADDGHRHSRKRIARLMRTAGCRARPVRQWPKTTIADPAAVSRPDLIRRDFTTSPAQADTRWCGDITYIPTGQGWLYLATVIDLASRRVVGWATAGNLKTDLVDAALTDALTRRRPPAGLIFHSDRGSQYLSAQHTRLADTHHIRLSTGRRGQCWDNAVAESFFATLKTELLHRQTWPTHTTARHAIFTYIEGWYNTRRRHSTLGYLSPTQYENTRPTPPTTNA